MNQFRGILLFLTCILLLTLPAAAFSPDDIERPEDVCKIVYGSSGAGRELTAYRFGEGKNVMVVSFAIHGYEDHFAKDGGALVYTASRLLKLLEVNRRVIDDYDWTVYILPCLNPDGLLDGTTCNGPGRCTTAYLNAAGRLVKGRGIDLNRSFPAEWKMLRTSRNYTGAQPMSAPEAQSLAAFTEKVRGEAVNLLIDVHGWSEQIFTSIGSQSRLYRVFHTRFPENKCEIFSNASGYYSYFAATLGYSACLFEFPEDIYSMEDFRSSGYDDHFCGCILDLLMEYGGKQVRNGYFEAIPWAWYNGLQWKQLRQDAPGTPFIDFVPGSWYADALVWAAEKGIIDHCRRGLYLPSAFLARQQLTDIFAQYPF